MEIPDHYLTNYNLVQIGLQTRSVWDILQSEAVVQLEVFFAEKLQTVKLESLNTESNNAAIPPGHIIINPNDEEYNKIAVMSVKR